MPVRRGSVFEVARFFLRLGATGFGGPAAHIAVMRQELVARRGWVSDRQFMDLVGATSLIPGPNSTEMVIHLGRVRAGWRGLLAGGVCFILPAMLVVMLLAWAYDEFGTRPQTGWILYGIKPVIIAVVAQALIGLGRTALRGPVVTVVAAAVVALSLTGVNELVLLFGGAGLVLALRSSPVGGRGALHAALPVAPLVGGASALATTAPYSLTTLFLTLLKIGSVLYGSGYVLLAFLRGDFVERLGWLTEGQLLDAVGIGQITPGPLLTTATFIGYLVGSWPGAVLATVAIFLPSFLFVVASGPLIPRLRKSAIASTLLDGVNAAALGLMAAVLWQLGREAIVDPLTVVVAVASAALLLRCQLNATWLVLGGAGIGLAARGFGLA